LSLRQKPEQKKVMKDHLLEDRLQRTVTAADACACD
jgi:hypothetical protein